MSENLFTGVPRIESPVFGSDPLDDLSETEKAVARDLNRQGFAIIDFPDPQLDERIERIRRNLSPRYDIPFDDPEADKTTGNRRIQDAWQFDEDVRAIAANSSIMQLLGKLYGRTPFPFQTLNFPVGTQQSAHSDSVHFSSLPERFMCGVWVAMEDVPADAGPLFYVPGSHRWPIVTNAMIGRRGFGSHASSAQAPYGKAWKAMCDAQGAHEETFLARKGQALIWCANLLHGGRRQINNRKTRWSQVTHYFFDDCIYYTPAFSDEITGQLQMRQLVAINDGKPRPNQYLGEEIRDSASATQSKTGKKPLLKKLLRWR